MPHAHDITRTWETLAKPDGGSIVYLILDGLGGLSDTDKGASELQAARIPYLDELARESSCGLLEIVGPGITPGSGPGHLALFGYDPFQYLLGRGILSALGTGFALQPGDVAARVNFATLDEEGRITDRRAGRISTEHNQALCARIREKIKLDFEGEWFFQTVSEHRAVLILRGSGLSGDLADTDPQQTGVAPRSPTGRSDEGQRTADVVRRLVEQVRHLLAEEKQANMILLRGFDAYRPYPSLKQRFKLTGVCLADYPMYRGVSRLLGMEVPDPPGGLEPRVQQLEQQFGDRFSFYFFHVKHTDSSGEDGDFDEKVRALEAVDTLIPRIRALDPDVLVVTGDHSTPAVMGRHSWHPVPVLLHNRYVRSDGVARFDEDSCRQGSLGLRPGVHLMGLALAHAGRLEKYGA